MEFLVKIESEPDHVSVLLPVPGHTQVFSFTISPKHSQVLCGNLLSEGFCLFHLVDFQVSLWSWLQQLRHQRKYPPEWLEGYRSAMLQESL